MTTCKYISFKNMPLVVCKSCLCLVWFFRPMPIRHWPLRNYQGHIRSVLPRAWDSIKSPTFPDFNSLSALHSIHWLGKTLFTSVFSKATRISFTHSCYLWCACAIHFDLQYFISFHLYFILILHGCTDNK